MKRVLAILGAGRLGSVLARQTPADWEKILVTRTRARADALARKCAGARSGELTDLGQAAVVFLAVPPEDTDSVLRAAAAFLAADALIVNCATGVLSVDLQAAAGGRAVVGAKIVGNVAQLDAPHLIVVDGASHRQFELLQQLLAAIGQVVAGSEEQVRIANTLAVEAALRAAVEIERGMARHRLPAAWRKALLAAVAAGALRGYADGDLGPLARSVLGRLEPGRGPGDG